MKENNLVNNQGVFRYIPSDLMYVDMTYQRVHTRKKIIAMAKEWSWIACGAITVSERSNGTYAIIDGQHRVLAAKSRFGDTSLPCLVFQMVSVSDEARGFYNADANRTVLETLAKFKAKLAYNDPETIYIKSVCNSVGIQIVHGKSPRCFRSVGLCYEMIRKSNRTTFESVMTCLSELCKNDVITSRVAAGLFYLATNLDGGIENPRFRNRLISTNVSAIEKSIYMAGTYYGIGGNKVWGIGILNAINKNLKNKFKLKLSQDE